MQLFFRRDLSENSISVLPSYLFHSQIHLKQLFLHRNRLVQIPVNAFATLIELQWLMLQENRLYKFPLQALEPLNALQWLNLSTNHLSFEGDRFPIEMGNLVELYVFYCLFFFSFTKLNNG